MVYSILYMLLALLALGFLVFIHELGHYFVARREGMTVEVFSIGFGKPILTWEHKGVKWQFCWLPFGGYVRIAGMEKKGSLEPYQIPDGFYGKKPGARIRVALMGPIVNIVFAFLMFTIIWMTGGRDKPFSEYTHLIGWIDPQSKMYQMGVRPGDEISQFDQHCFQGFNELIYSALLDKQAPKIKGFEIDYEKNQKTPFIYTLDAGRDVEGMDRAIVLMDGLSPASFLIYEKTPDGPSNLIPEGSPMADSGIQNNDRILWVDGELIFSKRQLVSVVNEPRALLTVKRGNATFLTRVPRLKISDLRLNDTERSELDDWQFEAGLHSKVEELYFIPYTLASDCSIENTLSYINEESYEQKHTQSPRSHLDRLLQSGDQILAVDGKQVTNSYELLSTLQARNVQMIVQRGASFQPVSWTKADGTFSQGVNFQDLQTLASSIGSNKRLSQKGDLVLLSPVQPKPVSEFPLSENQRTKMAAEIALQKKQIEKLKDPEEKKLALSMLEESQKKLMLGVVLQDRKVIYNPSPFTLFMGVFDETWRTLSALVTGFLSPKYMSGPVGIVQAIHHGWSTGVKEAMFWIAVISLNLGIINLFPVPVLDGGHICFALWEKITKKPIKAKTMERMIIPFIVLLISLFLYLTYNDILRLIKQFF